MEKLEFRPTKILLGFWLIGIAVVCLPVGGIITALCVETSVSLGVAFALGYILPMVIFGGYAVLFFNTIRYELDNRYITRASGVLWKQRRSVPLEKITNLDVRQGPFERIFGYGKIWVFTPSTGMATPEEKLIGIPKPHEMKQTLIDRAESAKQPQTAATQSVPSVESSGDTLALLTDIRDSLKNIEASLADKG